MIVEVTRLIDRWLKHPEHGVEAMLAVIPRNNPEGVDPAPAAPDIYNDIETEEVAGLFDPPTAPCLVVFADSDVSVDAKDSLRQIGPQLIVVVAYLTRDMPAVRAAIDGGYVLRAVRKSLTLYNKQNLSEDYRELNGIKVASCNRVTIQRMAGGVGKSQLWGFVLASLTIIDNDP